MNRQDYDLQQALSYMSFFGLTILKIGQELESGEVVQGLSVTSEGFCIKGVHLELEEAIRKRLTRVSVDAFDVLGMRMIDEGLRLDAVRFEKIKEHGQMRTAFLAVLKLQAFDLDSQCDIGIVFHVQCALRRELIGFDCTWAGVDNNGANHEIKFLGDLRVLLNRMFIQADTATQDVLSAIMAKT